MRLTERMLLRGLRNRIADDAQVEAVENGASDALGPMRKTSFVLTTDELLLATPLRTRTILTRIPRSDIQAIDGVGDRGIAVTFDDYDRAVGRTLQLEFGSPADRVRFVEQLRLPPSTPDTTPPNG